jgi:hypothetical protein
MKVNTPTPANEHVHWRELCRRTRQYYMAKYAHTPDTSVLDALVDMEPDPYTLIQGQRMINEADFKRHYGSKVSMRHIRAYRYMCHLLTDRLPLSHVREGKSTGTLPSLPDRCLDVRTHPAPNVGGPQQRLTEPHATANGEEPRPGQPPGRQPSQLPRTPYSRAEEPPHAPRTAPQSSREAALGILRGDTYDTRQDVFHTLVAEGMHALAALDVMYGNQDTPRAISGTNLVLEAGTSQRQYRVEWKDTVVEAWAIPHYRALGDIVGFAKPR